jgi:hypothetical protein
MVDGVVLTGGGISMSESMRHGLDGVEGALRVGVVHLEGRSPIALTCSED